MLFTDDAPRSNPVAAHPSDENDDRTGEGDRLIAVVRNQQHGGGVAKAKTPTGPCT
ncbi:hypothetical protein ACVIHI_008974 [Bradyrhizobium sp. USDA 4524]|nr:hypothetical protein [Bradyrhizobium sp. USDA 4539]